MPVSDRSSKSFTAVDSCDASGVSQKNCCNL